MFGGFLGCRFLGFRSTSFVPFVTFFLSSLDAAVNSTLIFIEVNSRRDVPGVMFDGYATQRFGGWVPVIAASGPADERHKLVKPFWANGLFPFATFLGFPLVAPS